jgi:hypothetical protein
MGRVVLEQEIFSIKERRKAIGSFFGWQDVPDIVITTPITKIFNYFVPAEGCVKKGWFLAEKISMAGNEIGLIKLHPGSSSEDVFQSLSWSSPAIIHLGFCFAFNKDINISETLFIRRSLLNGRFFPSKFSGDLPYRTVDGVNVPNVLRSYSPFLSSKNAEVSDMETGILYKHNTNSLSLNIVSDSLSDPFFNSSAISRKKIEKAISRLGSFVRSALIANKLRF